MRDEYQRVVLDTLADQGLPETGLRLRVNGDSMAPLLRLGDQVTVKPALPHTLQRGDILVIRRERDLVTHRLIRRQAGQRILTKGDHLPWPDPPFDEAALVGRVTALERDGRLFSMETLAFQRLNRRIGRLAAWQVALLGPAPVWVSSNGWTWRSLGWLARGWARLAKLFFQVALRATLIGSQAFRLRK